MAPSGVFDVPERSGQTFYFFPTEGHVLKEVWVNDVNVTDRVSKNVYTLGSIKKDVVLKVIFDAE